MRSICSSVVRLGLPLIVKKRSYVYLTSSALSSRPFTEACCASGRRASA